MYDITEKPLETFSVSGNEEITDELEKEKKKKEEEREKRDTHKLIEYLIISSISLTIALAVNDMMMNILDKLTVKKNEIKIQFVYIVVMVIVCILLVRYVV